MLSVGHLWLDGSVWIQLKKKTKKQADHWRVPRPVNKVPRVLITPMRPWWANDQDVAHLQAKTVPKNLIWSELAQFPKDSRSPYHAHGHAHYAHMDKWPWCCTSTGQDGSNELDLEWIAPMVATFWHPQDSWNPYQGHGHAHYAPMGK